MNVTFEGQLTLRAGGEIKPGDHVIRIVDEIPGEKNDNKKTVGLAGVGQNWVLVHSSIVDNVLASYGLPASRGLTRDGSPTLERTPVHELGHTMNLSHLENYGRESPGNLMYMSGNNKAGLELVYGQIERILKDYRSGLLNKGEQNHESPR